jgi:hypothetical protein
MPLFLFSNNATTTLAAPITASATTMQVAAGTGALFATPVPGTSVVQITLLDAASQTVREIVQCTAIDGDVLTVVRGQEGTAGNAYAEGDLVQAFITTAMLNNFIQQGTTAGGSLAGTYANPGFANNPAFTGNGTITGNFVSSGASSVFQAHTIQTDVNGSLNIGTGASNVGGSLAVAGTLSSPLIVTSAGGAISIGTGNSAIGGSLALNSTLTVAGLATFNGNSSGYSISAAQGIYAATTFATGATGKIQVGTGSSTIGGTLTVTGGITTSGGINVGATVSVTGNNGAGLGMALSSGLSVGGILNVGSTATFSANLNVVSVVASGVVNATSGGTLGGVTLSGSGVTAGGGANFGGGTVTAGNISISGGITAPGGGNFGGGQVTGGVGDFSGATYAPTFIQNGSQVVSLAMMPLYEANPGYQVNAQGWMIQWATGTIETGSIPVDTLFPFAFPNACAGIVGSFASGAVPGTGALGVSVVSRTTYQAESSAPAGGGNGFWYIAVGW